MKKSTNRLRFFAAFRQIQQPPQARRQTALRRSAETSSQNKHTGKGRRAEQQPRRIAFQLRQQLRRKRAGSGAGPDAQCRAQSKRTAGDDQQPPQAQREVQKMRRGERENIAAQPPARQEQHEQHCVQVSVL